jgi:hypothetical protein
MGRHGAHSAELGYASFVSSGLLNPSNSTGVNDELQINLQHIPAPAVDKAYYGWLLGDKVQSEPLVIPLGQLPFKAGTISFLFQGDQRHSNLLLLESRFLITEEDSEASSGLGRSERSHDLAITIWFSCMPGVKLSCLCRHCPSRAGDLALGRGRSVEEIAGRFGQKFLTLLVEAAIWKIVGDSAADGHLLVDLEQFTSIALLTPLDRGCRRVC